MTSQHLAIAMEYAPGGDLSEYVDACKRAGVRAFAPSPLYQHVAWCSPQGMRRRHACVLSICN